MVPDGARHKPSGRSRTSPDALGFALTLGPLLRVRTQVREDLRIEVAEVARLDVEVVSVAHHLGERLKALGIARELVGLDECDAMLFELGRLFVRRGLAGADLFELPFAAS